MNFFYLSGIIKLLKELKKVQSIEGLKNGKPLKDNDRIFTFHPDTISSYFVSFMRKNNLPKISLHKLRSGNITLQLYMGIDPKTASVRAGHSNVRYNYEYLRLYAEVCKSISC